MSRGDSALAGRVVFVVGCRRSGTNWLQRILTAHPHVVGMPSEGYLFSGALSKVAERFQHGNPGSPKTGKMFMSREGMLDAMRDFADRVFSENLERLGSDARYLVERTPWHVYDLELIGEVYPDARVIHIIRDGRDVARSLVSQAWGPQRLEDAAEEWRSSVTAGRDAGQALGQRYLEVRYEALLDSPERGIQRLYDWLGLDTDDGVLARALAEARSEFNVDPRAPVVASGKWRDAFSASEMNAFERVAGELLAELGYQRGDVPRRQQLEGLVRRAGSPRRLAQHARRRLERGAAQNGGSGYRVFEQFVDHIGADRLEAAVAMLAPQAHVRVLAGGIAREARGEAAKELLRDHLASSSGIEVISGNVHPGGHTSTSVTTNELPDGRTLARTLTVSAAEGTVHSVSLFDFELADTPLVART
jgi:Sulfotransferase family